MSESLLAPHIAFFDSGQGGLTILEEVRKFFPGLNYTYLGDNARAPYGNKSSPTITRYTAEAALFLAGRGAQMLIIACGTASSVAALTIQGLFRMPVVGIVEGLCQETALLLEKQPGSVAVLGTRFTTRSGRFEQELAKYGINKVWTQACPLFVPLVEEGIQEGPMVDAIADLYLAPIPRDVQVVMLACTHYPRLAQAIALSLYRSTGRSVVHQTIFGNKTLVDAKKDELPPIFLLDSSFAIVSQVQSFLSMQTPAQVAALQDGSCQKLWCTDAPLHFQQVSRFFIEQALPNAEAVEII